MPTRRRALKTLAGATVVGSISGCVQLASQRTVEYYGTPAMYEAWPEEWAGIATGVGVEARRTIKRFGVTKEIVTHNWGMLYRVYECGDDVETPGFVDPTGGVCRAIATFTTPSIEIAGQELNPVKNLTVGDIGREVAIASITPNGWYIDDILIETRGVIVNNATGKKVLRAFRESFDYEQDWDGGRVAIENGDTNPDWNGDTYTLGFSNIAGTEVQGTIRLVKHNGDFVMAFAVGEVALESINLDSRNPDNARGIAHPADDEFTEEMLEGHLRETNLAGVGSLFDRLASVVDDGAKNNNNIRRIVTASQDVLDDLYGPAGEFNTSSSRNIQLQLDVIGQDLQGIRVPTESLAQDLDRLDTLVENGRKRVRAGDLAAVQDVLDDIRSVVDDGAKDNSKIEGIAERGQDHVAEARRLVEDADGAAAEDARGQLLDGLGKIEDGLTEIVELTAAIRDIASTTGGDYVHVD